MPEHPDRLRHALVDRDGQVVNIICWNGDEWLPPKDHYVVRSKNAHIGDYYDIENNVLRRKKTVPQYDDVAV